MLLALLAFGVHDRTWANNTDGASDLGVDYVFMALMTLSPDFSAANYTIENDGGNDVRVSTGRLHFHFNHARDNTRNLQLELAVAYQKTKQPVPTIDLAGEYIDAERHTYGSGFGLLYDRLLTKHLSFTPRWRTGAA